MANKTLVTLKHVTIVQKIKVGTQGHKIYALNLSETKLTKMLTARKHVHVYM
jgi:hypothetical protein